MIMCVLYSTCITGDRSGEGGCLCLLLDEIISGELGWCLCQCDFTAAALCLLVSDLGLVFLCALDLVLCLCLWLCDGFICRNIQYCK